MGSDPIERVDTNGVIYALLRDLAAVQNAKQSSWGYKGAAAAVRDLEEPIESYVRADGTLEKIPHVGPSSARIIKEVLESGTSPTVERAIRESGKEADIAKRRALRRNFLSRAQVVAVLHDGNLEGPNVNDYRGDLQMHSVWSDGNQTLEEIILTGLERGYEFCAVTDHSYGLPIAGGVSMADLARQHKEIDTLNKKYKGRFRLIKGIEANIRGDGTVDMTPDELERLELVVAAPHSGLRSTTDQTARMLAVVRMPQVHIIGHPRGRMYSSRPGVSADWQSVFDAATEGDVAIEIDGDPSRQDIDFELARAAVRAHCVFALDSDAHSPPELRYAETAIAHARLAGVPTDRVINCWPADRLLQWLSR